MSLWFKFAIPWWLLMLSIYSYNHWPSLTICMSSLEKCFPVQFRPHGLQHTRLLCPSPTPRASSNSCPSNQWCQPTISFSVVPFCSCLQSFPASGSFLMKRVFWSALLIRWPKYWSFSFSISTSNEHSGWISFRTDWLDLLAVRGTSSPTPQFKSINSSALSFLYSPTLIFIHN